MGTALRVPAPAAIAKGALCAVNSVTQGTLHQVSDAGLHEDDENERGREPFVVPDQGGGDCKGGQE